MSLEDCSGCGLQGWGWQDNGYGAGVLGPLVWFASAGPQTIRVQQREDGPSFDQIVLSPAQYLTASPGATRVDGVILPQTQPGAAPDPVPPPVPASGVPEILLTSGAATQAVGLWRAVVDASASGGMALGTSDAGVPKVAVPAAAPNDYVDLAFHAEAGRAYRLWIRGRGDRDVWSNDSVYVQFSGSLDASDRPVARIGTAEAWAVNLEEGSNAGISGWGWQDSGYGAGVLGPLVRFASTGAQTLRIQTREDGFRIDQIVLSAERFLTAAPGPPKLDATILP